MNDAELYDHVHRLFGVGDWPNPSGQPYWQYRATQVHISKATRTKRRVSCADLAVAAEYCKAHGIDIRHMSWLYHHLADAKRWDQQRQRSFAAADLDEAIATAVAIETNPDWVDRLVRARGPYRQEVYDAWSHWRTSSSCSDAPGPASSAPTPS